MRGGGALRKIALGALGLYLLAVAGFTLYAQTGYVDSLPTAYLTSPGPGEISFTLAETGTVEDGKLHYSHQLGKGLPNDVIVPGLKVQYTGEDGQRGEGEVLSIASGIRGLSGAEIWLSLPEGVFREGGTGGFPGGGANHHLPGRYPPPGGAGEGKRGPCGVRHRGVGGPLGQAVPAAGPLLRQRVAL